MTMKEITVEVRQVGTATIDKVDITRFSDGTKELTVRQVVVGKGKNTIDLPEDEFQALAGVQPS